MLPLGPTGYGNSPYAALSAFAGNPLLISLENLAERGWIDRERLAKLPAPIRPSRLRCRRRSQNAAAGRGRPQFPPPARHRHLGTPTRPTPRTNWTWLEHYALYAVLRQRFSGAAWNTWPEELARRDPQALDELRRDRADDIAVQQILQFAFDEQWSALRAYCTQRGIKLIGDIAIFVNYDSADVWARPELFELDDNLAPIRVAGVPPDYFSATGQRWGNPLYKWDGMRESGFAWWVDRMRRAALSLRHHPPRPLPRIRGLLGHPRRQRHRRTRRMDQGPRLRTIRKHRPTPSASCPSSPKTSASSRRKSMPCASTSACPAWPSSSSASARAAARLSAAPLREELRRLHRHPRQQHHPGLVGPGSRQGRKGRRKSLSRAPRGRASSGT